MKRIPSGCELKLEISQVFVGSPTSKWRGRSGGEPGSSEGVGPAGDQEIGSGKTVDIGLMIANGSITQYVYIFDYNLLMFFV